MSWRSARGRDRLGFSPATRRSPVVAAQRPPCLRASAAASVAIRSTKSYANELRIFIDLPLKVSFVFDAPFSTRLMYVLNERTGLRFDLDAFFVDFFAAERAAALAMVGEVW